MNDGQIPGAVVLYWLAAPAEIMTTILGDSMATCRVCNGKRLCSFCHGKGKRGGVIVSSCESCRGKGHCAACDGKGWRN